MKQIRSSSNSTIQFARMVLKGREPDFCLLEGRTLILDALQSNVELTHLFVTQAAWENDERIQLELREKPVEVRIIPAKLIKLISDVKTSPGLVAIAKKQKRSKIELPNYFGAFVFSLRDPGNFGTIVRSAEAAGCEFVCYTSDSADPYQPKVIRASMGSIFRVPIHEVADAENFLEGMKKQGVHIYGLFPAGGQSIFDVKPLMPSLCLIGSERSGIPDLLPVDVKLRIPMSGRVESLNAAMAATICFYHFGFGR